ncbi:hypothetical protein CK203_051885 [Vitis vinifera]|uniref:Uncharacterized protein n=1 Tax=Vitis vinifera TaxID=29760 RepID=A0A438HAR3_VITVI|nr:hypothetical protein CK203_051885 [Vitis vinifera]
MLHMATPTIQLEEPSKFLLETKATSVHTTAQAPQQASNLEQAIVNLSKCGEYIEQKDGWMQNDLSQKIDNVQYAISRLTNLNTVQEKGKFPSQPHQNPKGIHEVEAQEGESSKVREVKVVITLRSVSIGGTCVEKALLDLGASVNLLPYSVYKQLGLGELKPTSITLSLVDRSVKIPRGMIEDVLVQVDKFYYPVDFVVLDTDPVEWSHATHVWQHDIELNIFHLYKKHIHPKKKKAREVCMIDTLVEEHYDKRMQEDLIENFGDLDKGLPEPSDLLATLLPWRRREEILPLFNEEEKQRLLRRNPKAYS